MAVEILGHEKVDQMKAVLSPIQTYKEIFDAAEEEIVGEILGHEKDWERIQSLEVSFLALWKINQDSSSGLRPFPKVSSP